LYYKPVWENYGKLDLVRVVSVEGTVHKTSNAGSAVYVCVPETFHRINK